MKTLNRFILGMAVLVVCAAAFVGWQSLQRRREKAKLYLDPETSVARVTSYLIPVITNFYSSSGLAPTMDYERNKQLLITAVTSRWDVVLATEQLPLRYQHRDDSRWYLFPPAKLESNTHSIVMLATLATNTVPDFWVAISHYNGNFETFLIKGYSRGWVDTWISGKPDLYFLTMRSGYLMHKQDERADGKLP